MSLYNVQREGLGRERERERERICVGLQVEQAEGPGFDLDSQTEISPSQRIVVLRCRAGIDCRFE